MNVNEAYKTTNALLLRFAGQASIEMPDHGTDHEKVQYLLDEYARRLKRRFWRYLIFCDNRRIPDLVCQYLTKMLTDDEKQGKAEQGDAHGRGNKVKKPVACVGPCRAGDR